MNGHLQIHWPCVVGGDVSRCRSAGFDQVARLLRDEVAWAWSRHVEKVHGSSGEGLARVVIIIDVAPEEYGTPVITKGEFS